MNSPLLRAVIVLAAVCGLPGGACAETPALAGGTVAPDAPLPVPPVAHPAGLTPYPSGFSGTAAAERPGNAIRGQIRPRHHTILAAGMAGRLESIPVEPGKTVVKGMELARFDCAAVTASHNVAKARAEAAAAKFHVNERLSRMQNVSGLDLELSRAELAIANAEISRIVAVERNCAIKAPFAGVVTEKAVQAFQYVAEGTPLLRLVDTRGLQVEAAVPSLWIDSLKPGSRFAIRIDETGAVVAGEIERTTGEVDAVSQTVRIIGRLIDPPEGLMPGMSGMLSLPSAKISR
ncbi:efflux RND transporter periplasmic adaptor subunit [Oleispirillum naphthae]|uniref:efflux RND transporter periplasmic adaptor subunit n=1 Tax=Oleispirillum naphthae TaxID=2838853 RepID=UPI0030822C9F